MYCRVGLCRFEQWLSFVEYVVGGSVVKSLVRPLFVEVAQVIGNPLPGLAHRLVRAPVAGRLLPANCFSPQSFSANLLSFFTPLIKMMDATSNGKKHIGSVQRVLRTYIYPLPCHYKPALPPNSPFDLIRSPKGILPPFEAQALKTALLD